MENINPRSANWVVDLYLNSICWPFLKSKKNYKQWELSELTCWDFSPTGWEPQKNICVLLSPGPPADPLWLPHYRAGCSLLCSPQGPSPARCGHPGTCGQAERHRLQSVHSKWASRRLAGVCRNWILLDMGRGTLLQGRSCVIASNAALFLPSAY